ncbi:MAG: PHP domain-containing protein [Anaerolineales bacterium]|nr:PHP domain-containing protein [Anaerolineales bacterium]
MNEIVINLHMHTTYSDGHVSHAEIAKAALHTGLDAVIVTDHNVWVNGPEDYYKDGKRRVLLLVGEEIHDQARIPQKSHLLVFGAGRELATLAWDIPRLLTEVRRAGGLAFIAHPKDPAAPAVGEGDISWEDWQVQGYTGIELWNSMSEFKSLLKSKLLAIHYAFNPERIAHGPDPEVLSKWDELLVSGQRVVAIGGSDAHAIPARLGPIHRTLFPYEFHFRCINTHLLSPQPLNGELEHDRRLILDALAQGRAFVGYDLPASTRGFRFTAQGLEKTVTMGEEISAQKGVTLQIRLPRPSEICLIKNGQKIKTWQKHETCAFITSDPGAYRVETYINFLGKRRGWIFSNPIYII